MSCSVECMPKPTVQWFKGKTEIKHGGRFSLRIDQGASANAYILICEISVSTSLKNLLNYYNNY